MKAISVKWNVVLGSRSTTVYVLIVFLNITCHGMSELLLNYGDPKESLIPINSQGGQGNLSKCLLIGHNTIFNLCFWT